MERSRNERYNYLTGDLFDAIVVHLYGDAETGVAGNVGDAILQSIFFQRFLFSLEC